MSRWKPLVIALLAAAAGMPGCTHDAGPSQPDVILVVVDTLRADRLGCYGHDGETSPNIDRFAEDALLFENALSHASDTLLSCAAMMSGYLPHETKIIGRDDLPREVPTLAETLQANGYETAAVVSNWVLREGQGFEQGFETFDSEMRQTELVRQFPERIAEFTTDRAIEILNRPRDRPLFLWVHYQDPHGPYTPPESFVREDGGETRGPVPFNPSVSGRGGIPMYQRLEDHADPGYYTARYDGEIRYADDEFGRLLEALEATGRAGNAVTVFTADHGEGMGEHDYYFAHGEYVYQGQIHVPLIVRQGEHLRGRRYEFVQHVDLVPTILGLLGLPAPESLRGADLMAGAPAERSIVSLTRTPLVNGESKISLVRDGLKLVYTPKYRAVQLYDLVADPREERSLAGDPARRIVAQEMLAEIDGIREADRLGFEPQDPPKAPTEEELEKLKSLGYVR